MWRGANARGLVVRAHRWIGLALGALFALMGLTGSFNVYHRELDAWLNPAYYQASAGLPTVSVDEAVARVRARDPRLEVLNIALPTDGHPYWIWFRDERLAGGAPGRQFQMAVDPHTGATVGPRLAWGGVSLTREALARTVYRLHYELWAGPVGKTAVGLLGVFLFLSLGLGLALWWPRRGAWRQALVVKRSATGARAAFDWHRAGGAWFAAALATLAFSGTYMVFPEYFHAAARPLGAVDDLKAEVRAAGGRHVVTLEDAARLARTRFPDGEVRFISPARGATGAIRVRLFRPGEANEFGRTFIWLEPAGGAVLRAIDGRGPSAAARFFNAQFPLHNGSIAGPAGRALVFITGFMPFLLFVTGVIVWRAKRRAVRMHANGAPRSAKAMTSIA